MQDAGSFAGLIEETTSYHENEEHATGSVEFVQDRNPSINDAPVQTEQPIKSAIRNARQAEVTTPVTTTAPSITTLSFAERRQLAHMHTLKQMVASDESLTADYVQAAKIYDNLNSTACFYTTALRLLSKADWSARVDLRIISSIKP